MKARVIATGDIVEATLIHGDNGKLWYDIDKSGYCLTDEELDFSFEREPDYWEKLKHQYAGMAMQGILGNQDYCKLLIDENQKGSFADDVSRCAKDFATALVNKLKGE